MAKIKSPLRFLLKRHKHTLYSALAVLFILNVNMNVARRAEVSKSHRGLATYLGDSDCSIDPLAELSSANSTATKTLLASYPGSGKRFSYQVINGLTNHITADDWNFSGTLNSSPLTIKTSWPHDQGVWSWDKQMDQVILLIRNPRWAIPSFHTMRHELNYASTFEDVYFRLGFVYSKRPAVAVWKLWRDANFDAEIDKWVEFIDFWMQGGIPKDATVPHYRCTQSEIVCKPKTVLDFDSFFQENPAQSFYELSEVLDASPDVEVITAQARVCVLDHVFEKKSLHNGNRDSHGLSRVSFHFTSAQLNLMHSKVIVLRDKYTAAPWTDDVIAKQLVLALNSYIAEIAGDEKFQNLLDQLPDTAGDVYE